MDVISRVNSKCDDMVGEVGRRGMFQVSQKARLRLTGRRAKSIVLAYSRVIVDILSTSLHQEYLFEDTGFRTWQSIQSDQFPKFSNKKQYLC